MARTSACTACVSRHVGAVSHPFACVQVCRCLPTVVKQYKLDELTNVPELRSNIALMFRRHQDVKADQVIDLLVYKGREELEMVMLNHKQRHHLVTSYVDNPVLRETKSSGMSPFLEAFLKGN